MLAFLVIDRSGEQPVHVFLETDPGQPAAEPVALVPLPVPVAGAVVGRSVRDRRLYMEFRSEAGLLVAGFEPVGPYRVCATWAEYRSPWPPPAPDQPTDEITDG